MASAPAKENSLIELPRLDVQMMEVTLVGDTPLISHAWSTKARRAMLASHMKKAKGAKAAKDPNEDFLDSLYKLADGGYGFPSVAFKSAAVTAITSISGVTKVQGRQAFHVLGEDMEVDGALDGLKIRQNLVRIGGSEPRIREDMVRLAMMKSDIRYRGEFWPWNAKVLVRFNGGLLSTEQVLNLFNVAGFAVGIGEWRPERDGQYGMFHVAQEHELAAPKKKRGKK